MSTTLNLADRLLSIARIHRDLGRTHDALDLYRRLASLGDLPPAVAEEVQASQAELLMQSGRYVKARRHLRAAIEHSPDNARYHHLLGNAIENDERGDLQASADHYRRSLELDPDQPQVLSDLGLLCLRLGQPDEGLAHLRRAVELAPDEPTFLENLVLGLRDEGRDGEAFAVVRAARFRHRRDARFEQLYNRVRFEQVRAARASQRLTDATDAAPASPPRWILPFTRPEGWNGPTVRRDNADTTQAPHLGQRKRMPDRHVQ